MVERQPTAFSGKSPLICAVIVFAVALTVYILTLAPTVGLVDSGELTVAASKFGVPHPPGFPFYILLTHVFSLVPIGKVAVRVNFASALFATLVAATLTMFVAHTMRALNASPWRIPFYHSWACLGVLTHSMVLCNLS